jgi:hypothetical protein
LFAFEGEVFAAGGDVDDGVGGLHRGVDCGLAGLFLLMLLSALADVLFVALDGVLEFLAGAGDEFVHDPGGYESSRYAGEDASHQVFFAHVFLLSCGFRFREDACGGYVVGLGWGQVQFAATLLD